MNEELRTRLIEVAMTEDGFLPYSQAARILHIEADRLDHSRELAEALDEISTYEHEQGRPLLSALVVHQDDLQPGGGFFKMAQRVGKQSPGEDDDAFYFSELRNVRDYWQGHVRYTVTRDNGMTTDAEFQAWDALLTERDVKRRLVQRRVRQPDGTSLINTVARHAWSDRGEAEAFAALLSSRTRKIWRVNTVVEWDIEIETQE
jgi:hypothetical protein